MQQKQKEHLEDYSIPQLNILLKHIRLGFDHLQTLLTNDQIQNLLNAGTTDQKQEALIIANRLETFGHLSLVINTILTSTFGAWMGLSSCVGCEIGSIERLSFITLFAFFISGIIGYISLRVTKNQAYHAYDNQRLYNFQLRTLRLINDKMALKIKKITFYFSTAILILKNQQEKTDFALEEEHSFQESKHVYYWLNHIEEGLENRLNEFKHSHIHTIFKKNLSYSFYSIKKNLIKYANFLDKIHLDDKKEKKFIATMPFISFLKVLTTPAFDLPNHLPSKNIIDRKSQFNSLLLGLITTIWGGFASMFVFVGGIPTIVKELGFNHLADFLVTPSARVIEVGLALLMSLYFAFAFIYTNHKKTQRDQLLEETEKEIANEETLLLQNNYTANIFYKVKSQLQKLITIFNVLKEIDPFIHKKNE